MYSKLNYIEYPQTGPILNQTTLCLFRKKTYYTNNSVFGKGIWENFFQVEARFVC